MISRVFGLVVVVFGLSSAAFGQSADQVLAQGLAYTQADAVLDAAVVKGHAETELAQATFVFARVEPLFEMGAASRFEYLEARAAVARAQLAVDRAALVRSDAVAIEKIYESLAVGGGTPEERARTVAVGVAQMRLAHLKTTEGFVVDATTLAGIMKEKAQVAKELVETQGISVVEENAAKLAALETEGLVAVLKEEVKVISGQVERAAAAVGPGS